MSDSKLIDDDWKKRAEEEKKKLDEKFKEQKTSNELPPASFATLMSTFATQAMIALGEIQIPGAEGRGVDMENAKFSIDTLDILKEKTRNNLSDQEEKALKDIIQSLKLRFVQKKKEESKIKTPDDEDSTIIKTPDQFKKPKNK